MINANELRIGNLIKRDDHILRVVQIKETQMFRVEYVDKSISSNHMFLDHNSAEPIPLTDEILLKCGFIFDKDNEDYNLNGITLDDRNTDKWSKYINKDEFGIWYLNSYLRDIKYLHQLQNLFYSITDTELEISL